MRWISTGLVAGLMAGCGGDTSALGPPVNVFDLSQGTNDLAGQTGDTTTDLAVGITSGTAGACNGQYAATTIAAMRSAAKTGCFQFENVVSLAVTPVGASSTSVRIVVQDPAGGDYSAIVLSCSQNSSTHPCAAFTTAKNILAGRALTIAGTFYKGSATKGSYETFDLDTVSDNSSATAPAASNVPVSDIERSANKANLWFQKVTLNIGSTDQLKMFDFSPPEFKSTTTTSGCGMEYGFGMLPKSATGTAGAACSGTTQPTGQTSVNASEVLIGTDFHGGFTANSECGCISTKTSKPYPGLVSSTTTLSGVVSGILFYDTSGSVGYQFLSPILATDAPLTNLSN